MGNQLRHTRTHLNMMGVVEVFGDENRVWRYCSNSSYANHNSIWKIGP